MFPVMSEQSSAVEDCVGGMHEGEEGRVIASFFVRALRNRVADVLSALVLFPVMATYLLSYTALVYNGPLAHGRPAGLAAMLVTSLVAGLITATASSFRAACGTLDNNATAIMAMVAGAIAADMGAKADPDSVVSTVIVGMAIAGAVSGLSLLALGLARAGGIVRLLPLQVTAGFVGTTGWILASGGLRVGLGRRPGVDMFLDPLVDAKLAGMLAMAGVFALLSRRVKSPFLLPGLIASFVVAHHLLFSALGISFRAQLAAGWLIAFPDDLSLVFAWSPSTLGRVDWTALSHQSLALAVLAVVSPISLLLTATGLETAVRREANVDHELVVGGASALASAAAGGTIGFITFARSVTLKEAGGRSRLAPVLATLLIGVAPFAFPAVLSVIPVPVLGGLLFYLGAGLLYKWVFQTYARMPLGEWATIPAVVALSVAFSVIVGILAGLLIGCVNFTVAYGLGAPVRARYFGDVAVSNVWRSHADRQVLWETAQQRLVLYLQGFLFFGSANRLLREARAEIDGAPDMRRLVLDFGAVDGVDTSAISTFQKIVEIAQAREIDLIFASAPVAVAERLTDSPAIFAGSLDEALEWSEERTLAEAGRDHHEPETLVDALVAAHGVEAAQVILDHFVADDVPAGAVIMSQGETTNDLAFLESGRASVFVMFEDRPPLRVRTLVVGTMIGELGFYVGSPRSATIVAETDCRIIRVAPADIDRLEADHPHLALEFHRMIARRLCLRINDKDHLIAGLMRGMRRAEG
jgi:sulfate permease, SulP family